MTFLWLLQVNNAGASGVVVDEEGLKAFVGANTIIMEITQRETK